MKTTISNLLLEILLLVALGLMYYFYQRKKILKFEKNKIPMTMGWLIQSCLMEKGESENPELDKIIILIDDYLHNKTDKPPIKELVLFRSSSSCSKELNNIINEILKEIDEQK